MAPEMARPTAGFFEDSFRALCPKKLGSALLALCAEERPSPARREGATSMAAVEAGRGATQGATHVATHAAVQVATHRGTAVPGDGR